MTLAFEMRTARDYTLARSRAGGPDAISAEHTKPNGRGARRAEALEHARAA
jgi:hypothetical protein